MTQLTQERTQEPTQTQTRKHWIILSLLAALGIVSALFVDVPLARWIDAHSTPAMHTFGEVFGHAGQGQWILGYCAVVALLAFYKWRRVAYRHAMVFMAVAASGITANIIKIIVCRPRPPLMLSSGEIWPHLFSFSTTYLWNSFPSGHATTGMAIAVAGSAAWPRLRWLMWSIGMAVVLSRIAYNVHYVSDVIAGSMLGIVVSWACVQRLTILEARQGQGS